MAISGDTSAGARRGARRLSDLHEDELVRRARELPQHRDPPLVGVLRDGVGQRGLHGGVGASDDLLDALRQLARQTFTRGERHEHRGPHLGGGVASVRLEQLRIRGEDVVRAERRSAALHIPRRDEPAEQRDDVASAPADHDLDRLDGHLA
jgi:hypothetical protein